jgi:hypothetical protein
MFFNLVPTLRRGDALKEALRPKAVAGKEPTQSVCCCIPTQSMGNKGNSSRPSFKCMRRRSEPFLEKKPLELQ